MLKRLIAALYIFWCIPAFAANTQLNIDAADAYWAKKQNHTDATGVNNYSAAHPQNTTDATSAGGTLGGSARQNYSNASSFSDMLNAHSSGTGGILDLAGLPSSNTKTTKYDICVLNNPRNPAACSTDKADSDAYKACKVAHPTDFQTVCANMAGALASINYQSGCTQSKDFLKISYVPSSSTMDIDTLVIIADPRLTGSSTVIQPLPAPASGICSNGLITCDPGTWNNCEYYKWTSSAGVPGLTQTTNMSEIGGCYCVNKSCGGNLPFLNGTQILRDITAGVTGAILSTTGEGVEIVDTKPDLANLTIKLMASKVSDCNGTAGNSSPSVATSDPAVSNLTGIAQRMTNNNPTTDYLEQAGANASATMDAQQDSQGDEISASGFADPAVRAQWKADYQANGNNYLKMIKQTDNISNSATQDVQCTIKDNYNVATTLNTVTGNGTAVSCTDTTSAIQVTKSGNTYNLNYIGVGWNWCVGGPSSIASWNYVPPLSGTSTVSSASTSTGGIVTGATSTDIAAAASTTTVTTATILGVKEEFAVNFSYSCVGSGRDGGSGVVSNTNANWRANLPGNCTHAGAQTVNSVYDYTMTFTTDTASEGLVDGCATLESNTNCTLKSEAVDGINIKTNFMNTGLSPLPSCKSFSGQVNAYPPVCRPWWIKKRTYQCSRTQTASTDVQDIVKRGDSINQSTRYDANTGDITFNDKAKDSSGNWSTTAQTSQLKTTAASPGSCDLVCRVSKIATDSQARTQYGSTVNTTANPATDPARTGVGVRPATATGPSSAEQTATKQYNYLYCNPSNPLHITANASDWTCPAKPDETVENPCACPDNFGQNIGKVSALIEASKTQKCTTGALVAN